jgi:tetratricopeptide (TPR) repeat protein
MHERRFPEAVEALTRVLRLEPQDTEARIVLVEALLNVGQQLQAREEVGRILESKQTQVSLLPKLAASLIRGNELTSARAVLDKALSLSPSMAEAYLELSRLDAATGQDDEAIRAARRGVELAPSLLEAQLTLAEALIGSKRYLEALDSLSQVEARFENSAAFHYTRGIAEMGLHRSPAAIAALKRAVELDPNYDRAQFLLATAYYTTGDFERAEAGYKAAIALNNTNALYFSHLAGLYERQGPDFEQAARNATQQALTLNPDDPECNQRMAKWAIGRGDFLGARAILEKVVARNPRLIPPRILLIHVYNELALKASAQEQQRMIQSLQEEARKQRARPVTQPVAEEEKKL